MFALRMLILCGFLATTYGMLWMVRAKKLPWVVLPFGYGLAMFLVIFAMPASSGESLERSAIIGGTVGMLTATVSSLLLYIWRDRLVVPRPVFFDFVVRPWPASVKRRAVRLVLLVGTGLVVDAVWYGIGPALVGLLILLAIASVEWATAVSQRKSDDRVAAHATEAHGPRSL